MGRYGGAGTMVSKRIGKIVATPPAAAMPPKATVDFRGLYDFLSRYAEGLQGPDRVAFRENLGRLRRREVSHV